jgi:bile acid:Na+ symporter, BASS family
MLAMGLSLTLQAVFAPLRNFRLVLLALALNFILAPGYAWLLTIVIPLQRGHAIGILLLGAAAGAPFLPTLVETARGDLAAAVALTVLLTIGTVLFMPLALPLLIPGLQTDTWSIARPLVTFIVLPMIIGMIIKPRGRRLAARAAPVLAKIGNACLLLLFVLLIALTQPCANPNGLLRRLRGQPRSAIFADHRDGFLDCVHTMRNGEIDFAGEFVVLDEH